MTSVTIASDVLDCLRTILSGPSSTLISEENNTAYRQLKDYIANDNSIFIEENTYGIDKNFANQARLSLKLSPEQRKELVKQVDMLVPASFRNGHRIHMNHRFLMKLALYDPTTWDEYIDLISKNLMRGDANTALLKLPEQIQNMPTDLKERVIKKVGSLYKDAQKIDTNWTGPKRFLDGVMSFLIPPQQSIKASVDAGASPMKALDQYLKDVNDHFLKGSSMGGYDAEALLSTGKIYQDFMHTHSATLPENFSVTITGSFSNGKANLATSDIDILVSDHTFEKYYKDIDKIINDKLKEMGHSNSRLETHSTPETFSLYDLASVNPVTIKITKNAITLQVFPPITITSRDISLAGKKYPTPDLHELFLRPQ